MKTKGKGVLLQVTPKMKGGVHDTFETKHGRFYNQVAVFKTDKNPAFEFTFASKEPQVKWGIGSEYEFEVEQKSGTSANGPWSFWTGKILSDKQWGGGKYNREDSIVAQTCIKCASEFHAQRTGSNVQAVIADAEILFNWVKSKS